MDMEAFESQGGIKFVQFTKTDAKVLTHLLHTNYSPPIVVIL